MSNPSPVQSDDFKANRYPVQNEYNVKLAEPLTVRLPQEYDQYIRSLPNRNFWLRQVICDAIYAEFMTDGSDDFEYYI